MCSNLKLKDIGRNVENELSSEKVSPLLHIKRAWHVIMSSTSLGENVSVLKLHYRKVQATSSEMALESAENFLFLTQRIRCLGMSTE